MKSCRRGLSSAHGVLDSPRVKEPVVPNEIAKQLGVTGPQIRNWLRAEKAAGHPILAGHQYRQRWEFSRAELTS